MKQGVLGEGAGRGWGTRENDESGNDIGGLRRRPRGHAPPYSLLFLVLDLGPPQPLPPHPPVMPPPRRFTMVVLASPWFLRAPPLFPALSPTFPLSSFLPSVCWLVSLHTRLLGRAGRDGEAASSGAVCALQCLGPLPRGAGEGREDHRAVLGPWRVGGWETPALLFTHLAPRPRICHR